MRDMSKRNYEAPSSPELVNSVDQIGMILKSSRIFEVQRLSPGCGPLSPLTPGSASGPRLAVFRLNVVLPYLVLRRLI